MSKLNKFRTPAVRLVLACLLPFVTGLVQWSLWKYIHPYVWFLFFPAIFLAPWIGGRWGGIGATLISILLIWYFFMDPPFSFALESNFAVILFVLFLSMGVAFALFHGRLRSQEAKYAMVFNQAGEGIVVLDIEGRFLDANKRYCDIVGRSRDEIIGVHISDFDPGITPEFMAEADVHIGEKGYITFDRPMSRKDGTPLMLRVTVARLPRNLRQCIVRDVTQSKQVEEKLLKSRNDLMEAQRQAHVGNWEWEVEADIVGWSEELFRIFGLEPAAVAPPFASQAPFYTPESLARIRAHVTRCLETGDPYDTTMDIIRPNGEVRHVMSHGERLPGPVKRMRGTLVDITAQRDAQIYAERALEQMTRSEALFRTIFDKAPLGMLLVDSKTGNINEFNERFARIVGRTREELARISWIGLTHPDDVEDNRRVMKQIYSGELPEALLVKRYLRPDGSVVWCRVTVSPIVLVPGENKHHLSMIEDITEQKMAEEATKKLDAMKQQVEKGESLARMVGAVAHHFNNKLMAVMGNLELSMKMASSPDMVAERNDTEAQALSAARQAADVCTMMLTYLGQVYSDRKEVDLSQICAVSLPRLRASMPPGVKFEASIPEPGPTVLADAVQVRRVLTSLITNAIEAMETGTGTILLAIRTVPASDIPATHRFPIDFQPHRERYACIEVADTGCGIDPGVMRIVFDPFYSTKFTGRGVELPVALGIVKKHEGVFTVESTLGKGSVFRMFLPVAKSDAV